MLPTTSLSQLLAAARPIPRGVALRIAIDVCAALESVHGAQSADGKPLVHGGLSPYQVRIDLDGVASLRDSGTGAGTERRGAFGYLSPEYLRTGVSTASCDMFAFGIVVWEMLAGRSLFKGGTDMDSVERTLNGAAPRLSSVVPGIPALLDVVIAKALAHEPIDRFATMQALRVALEGAARSAIATRDEVVLHVASVAVFAAGAGVPGPRASVPKAPRPRLVRVSSFVGSSSQSPTKRPDRTPSRAISRDGRAA